MPIERGKDWGTVVPPGLVDVIATTDAEVRTVVEHCWAAGKEVPPIAIIGGDLWRGGGAPGGGLERIRSDEARMVSIDAAQVQLDAVLRRRQCPCGSGRAQGSPGTTARGGTTGNGRA